MSGNEAKCYAAIESEGALACKEGRPSYANPYILIVDRTMGMIGWYVEKIALMLRHQEEITKQRDELLKVVLAGGHTEECMASVRFDYSSPCVCSCATARKKVLELCDVEVRNSSLPQPSKCQCGRSPGAVGCCTHGHGGCR